MSNDDWIHELTECPWCGGTSRSKPRPRFGAILCANPWHNLANLGDRKPKTI